MGKTRYLALDVFRGMTVALMILVNNPGSWSHIYAPLRHAAWHGCTPTDLVFPFFLFIVGVSMFFSFSSVNHTLDSKMFLRILKRAVLIFAIGLFLSSFPQWKQDFSKLRIPGVLQRIAIAYFAASVIVLTVGRKWLPWISGAVLVGYWALLKYGGTGDPYSLEGNIVAVADKAIFGENHIYKGFGLPFDPEGLLSTLPAVITVITGYLAGAIINTVEKHKIPIRFSIIGITGIAAGLLWSLLLPLNKPLWTSSYVVYTAGWAFIILALMIWITDIKGITGWTSFFTAFGMNPLFIFALSGLWARFLTRIVKIGSGEEAVNGYNWLYTNVFQPLAGDINGSLLFALFHILVFWLIVHWLQKKKIYIKV
jgi:predicted acyltransferase